MIVYIFQARQEYHKTPSLTKSKILLIGKGEKIAYTYFETHYFYGLKHSVSMAWFC